MISTRMLMGSLPVLLSLSGAAGAREGDPIPGGELRILPVPPDDEVGQIVCPLRHTDVQADIVGYVSRVRVRQVFYNPLDRKIEAIYIFPLPQGAAVDDMVMTVGERRIVGQIKPREEARRVYEESRAAGHVTSLLDQERPNIFTQSVANIEPGVEVVIEIGYAETLKYEDGQFEFMFPMVVGPRYIPGGGSAPAPMTSGRPTAEVPDGDRITPPVVPPGMRAGHDISLTVSVDAGLPIGQLESTLHQVKVDRPSASRAVVTLANLSEIPNKDFVLHYRTDNAEIGDAFFTHTDPRGRFLTLFLQPPRRVVPDQLVSREIIFVLDTSGSMRGFPIDKAKEVMSKAIDAMRAGDTFNLITFAGDTRILWSAPRPNTPANRAEAQAFLASHRGGGGTEMMKAIEAALVRRTPVPLPEPKPMEPCSLRELMNLPADGRAVCVTLEGGAQGVNFLVRAVDSSSASPYSDWAASIVRIPEGPPPIARGRWVSENGERVLVVDGWCGSPQPAPTSPPAGIRVVCFMTDGYVGNDMAIIDAVKKNAETTRVFSFGVGNSVNRFLLDGLAQAGRGEAEYVLLQSDAEAAVRRFAERISAPVLTDIEIDWGKLAVSDVRPAHIRDLFSSTPIMVHARLDGPAGGTVTLRGQTGAGPFRKVIQVSPGATGENDALASLWARAKVSDLMMQDYAGLQRGQVSDSLREQITTLGVTYRLMTQFTSFVAVEEMTVTVAGEPTKITVPVEMPDGVSYEGVFGTGGGGVAGAVANMKSMRGITGAKMQGPARVREAFQSVESPVGASPTSPPAPGIATRTRLGTAVAGDESRIDREVADPESKLAEVLRGLADRVEKDGRDGNLTVGKLRVVDFKLDVRVYLADTSAETMKALADLGFTVTGESKAIRMLIGTIDVRKLKDLAGLESVVRIAPARDS